MLLNLAKAIVVALGWLFAYAYLLRFERRVFGHFAVGGNPRWGALWPLVDVLRALGKPDEGVVAASPTVRPGRYIPRWLPPLLTVAATGAALVLIPAGPTVRAGGIRWSVRIAAVDPNLLIFFLLSWVATGGMLLGAWRSGMTGIWTEAGAVAGQALGYSLVVLFVLAGVIMLSGSLGLEEIVRTQAATLPYAVYQPLGLLICAVAFLAGGRRLPFSLPGAEDALLADWHLQHAGRSLALYHLAEYLHLLLISGLMATAYLGGWWGPGGDGFHWLALKTLAVAVALLWVRHGWLARRRRALLKRGWLALMALAALNTLVTALILAWRR